MSYCIDDVGIGTWISITWYDWVSAGQLQVMEYLE